MADAKERLVDLVKNRDLSSIQVMASELSLDEDEVRSFLAELATEGRLNGYITEDGKRFFRSDITVPTPGHTTPEDVPEFLKYDTLPGKFLAFVGLMIMVIAGVLLAIFSGTIYYENLGTALLLIGLVTTMAGCYHIGRRKTPQ